MKRLATHLFTSVRRGCLTLMRRPLFYFVCIVAIPLGMTLFLSSLLEKGVANRVPSAIVDLDNSVESRNLYRNLNALQQVDIQYYLNSYSEAMDYIKRDKILGFFLIPEGFGSDAVGGRTPTLTYYINFAYIVPGSLLEKGFTTMSMLADGALVEAELEAVGATPTDINSTLQPIANDIHNLGNINMNYGVYLVNSFAPGVLALMVMLVTCYVITIEIKERTSRQWLNTAGNYISIALTGKLLPLSVLFTLVGWIMQGYFYGIEHYPMNSNLWIILLAMWLLVIACQAFAVIVCSILPNPRLSLSVCSLVAMLAFSLGGYSFPVEDMYPALAIFSHILPMRYYFLIYADQALNGIGFAYSAHYFIALAIFPIVAVAFMPMLKKAMTKPVVYIP